MEEGRGGGGIFSDDEGTSSASDEGLMRKPFFSSNNFRFSSSLSESEEEESSELFEIKLEIEKRSGNIKEEEDYEGSWFSFDFRKWDDCVYVGVGDNVVSGMDALQWTLKHAVSPSTIVYLLHVFPEIRRVPSPLGMLPRSRVNPRLVEKHMAEEKGKRREFLHKFVDVCSAAQVKVEVLIIESDMVAKTILDLIPSFHIRKLILGSTKARKWRSRRGRAIAKQVLQNADEFCDVKIICEGRETTFQMIESSCSPQIPSSSNSSDNNENINIKSMQKEHHRCDFFSCMCFGF